MPAMPSVPVPYGPALACKGVVMDIVENLLTHAGE